MFHFCKRLANKLYGRIEVYTNFQAPLFFQNSQSVSKMAPFLPLSLSSLFPDPHCCGTDSETVAGRVTCCLDDVSTCVYIQGRGERAYDIFSRLLRERIICLMGPVWHVCISYTCTCTRYTHVYACTYAAVHLYKMLGKNTYTTYCR